MSATKSPSALSRARAILELALSKPEGVTIPCRDHAEAMSLRFQCHQARSVMREKSKRIFSEDDPRYGVSVYDSLELVVETRGDKLYAFPITAIKIDFIDNADPKKGIQSTVASDLIDDVEENIPKEMKDPSPDESIF